MRNRSKQVEATRRRNRSGGDRPSFQDKGPLPFAEVPVPPEFERSALNKDNSYVRAYTLGPCSILVTKEFGEWHLSVAHPSRYPTWDEVAAARYRIVPDSATMAMILPPKAEYINIHSFCFQLIQIFPGERGVDRA